MEWKINGMEWNGKKQNGMEWKGKRTEEKRETK